MFNAQKTIFIMVSNTLNPDKTALTESRYMVDVPVNVCGMAGKEATIVLLLEIEQGNSMSYNIIKCSDHPVFFQQHDVTNDVIMT